MRRVPSCLLSSPSSLLPKPSLSPSSCLYIQTRHYAKPSKREHHLKTQYNLQNKTQSFHPVKRNYEKEVDGWSPLDAPPPEPIYHSPSTYTPPTPTIDTAHNDAAMEALESMGFLEKLKNLKNNNWLSAFEHRYIDSNTTYAANREMETKGQLALVAALRMYIFQKYPLLPPVSVAEASRWFTSPIATARFAKFLNFDQLVYFTHDPPTTAFASEYDTYKTLQAEERVHLLSSTYNSLMGIIYEQGGISALLPLVDVQVNWVEGLEISVITEKEPASKTQAKRKKLEAALKQSFPQPEKRVANWLVSALGALYNSTLGITPKMVADRYFKLCSLGRPTYNVIRESGRLSRAALFVVGVYNESGAMLGQGYGSSIRTAEHEAAKAAMERVLANKDDRYGVHRYDYNK